MQRPVVGPLQLHGHYDVLQVAPWCDQEVVHAAYRALARRWHPDLNRGAEADAQMRRLNAAYHVLGDPKRRADYDRDLAYRARLAERRVHVDHVAVRRSLRRPLVRPAP